MMFSGTSANKHLKFLEGEKAAILSQESNNATIEVADGRPTIVDEYNFAETRQNVKLIDEEMSKIKHALNVFNTTVEVEPNLTIDAALLKLAQLNKELVIVTKLKDRPKEAIESRYPSQVLVKTNYDTKEVEAYYRLLAKQIYELQMNIDKANMLNTFEVEGI